MTVWSCSVCGHIADHAGRGDCSACGVCLRYERDHEAGRHDHNESRFADRCPVCHEAVGDEDGGLDRLLGGI